MPKGTLRIVELIHDAGSDRRQREYVIEARTFFGSWKELFLSNGFDLKRNSFMTYQEAEMYLLENYCGHGVVNRNGNVYGYKPYTYM